MDDGSVGAPGGVADGFDSELADLLADVSRMLATEREPDQALALVLDRIVPAVADWGTVRLREPDGRIRRVAATHRDPAGAELVDELWKTQPFTSPDGAEVTELFSGGGAQVYEGLGEDLIDLVAASEETRDVWKRLGVESLAVVPLLAGGVALGSIMLVISDDRRFDREGLRMVEGMALQCALLVENTRLVREKELATQERIELGELLDNVLAHSPAATAILDSELRVLHANAAFAGLGSAEVGTHLAEALSDLAGRVAPIAQTVLDEGRAVDRAMVRSRPGPDGRRYWQVTAFPVDQVGGGRLGVGLVLAEVTEERRSARRLTDSLARLDLSLAAGGLGSWDWDFLRNEIVWSGTLADVLGVDPNAFTSDPYAFTEIIHPDDRQEHRDRIIAAAQAGEDFHNEVRVVRMDGEERWVEVRGAPSRTPAISRSR